MFNLLKGLDEPFTLHKYDAIDDTFACVSEFKKITDEETKTAIRNLMMYIDGSVSRTDIKSAACNPTTVISFTGHKPGYLQCKAYGFRVTLATGLYDDARIEFSRSTDRDAIILDKIIQSKSTLDKGIRYLFRLHTGSFWDGVSFNYRRNFIPIQASDMIDVQSKYTNDELFNLILTNMKPEQAYSIEKSNFKEDIIYTVNINPIIKIIDTNLPYEYYKHKHTPYRDDDYRHKVRIKDLSVICDCESESQARHFVNDVMTSLITNLRLHRENAHRYLYDDIFRLLHEHVKHKNESIELQHWISAKTGSPLLPADIFGINSYKDFIGDPAHKYDQSEIDDIASSVDFMKTKAIINRSDLDDSISSIERRKRER